MKIVKFRDYLVPLVLSGDKVSTWRLFDDKNLTTGDIIGLKEFGQESNFAIAKITKVIEKLFGELSDEDKESHESYSSDAEMYATYSGYYKAKVDERTPVKIIWFEVIK